MPLRSGGQAPYTPPKTVLDLIASYRDRSLRVPFNREVLRLAGVSDGLINRTLQTLKLLDLIDEQGNPTPPLEGLRRAPGTEFKTRLEAVVRDVYGEVFQFADPAKDDTDRITDAFRAYEPAGQRSRMVTLFIGLCDAAGMIPEGKKPAASTGRGVATPRAAARARVANGRDQGGRPASFTHGLRADGGVIVPEAITGLIRSIPFDGWTQGKRDAFMKLFGAVLDYTVPVVSVDAMGDKIEDR